MTLEDSSGEPKQKPRVGLLLRIGIAVAVFAIAGGVYALASSNGPNRAAAKAAPSSPPTTSAIQIVVPAAAGGLSQLTGSAAETVTADLKKKESANPMFAGAKYAAYANSSAGSYFGTLTLVPLDASFPLKTEYQTGGAKSAVADVMDGFATDVSAEPALQGGAMSCGLLKTSVSTVRSCAWMDAAEYGMASYPGDVTNAQAAAYSTALWKASEES